MPKSQEGKGRLNYNELLSNANDADTFSQLTYLLHLVTALNSNDNLRSGFHEYRYGEGKAIARDEGSLHSLSVTLLDSVVAILVQQHEVVAACYASDKVSVMVVETDPNPSTDDDSDVLVESPLPGSHTFYPLQLAAISNPDFNSSNNAKLNANPHNLQIQTNGENLWTRVRDSHMWYCVLM